MCANRDPQTPPRDHTVAIIAGVVALFALLVELSVRLEDTDSPNTMVILAVLGTGIGSVIITQLFAMSKSTAAVKQATDVAVAANEVAVDTNARTQELNGSLTEQFDSIHKRLDSIDGRLTDLEGSIDARARSAVTAVNSDPDREAYFDNRMRGIVDKALDRREAMCKVSQPQQRRRRN